VTLALKIDQANAIEPVLSGWYAAYTHARHEKKVALQLQQRGIEHFLPLYRSVRRWKDRRKELDLVLFPGYVFVRVPLSERLRVLQVAGVARFVTFNGQPATLIGNDIEALRNGLEQGMGVQNHPYLTPEQNKFTHCDLHRRDYAIGFGRGR
jgi:transcription antitermination factor NusG